MTDPSLPAAVDAVGAYIADLERRLAAADRWEKLLRRIWFFLASVIPYEWRDETVSYWMKQSEREKK